MSNDISPYRVARDGSVYDESNNGILVGDVFRDQSISRRGWNAVCGQSGIARCGPRLCQPDRTLTRRAALQELIHHYLTHYRKA